MRSDMHELLVERPRWGHQARYPRAFVRNRAGHDPPSREPMSRSRYGDKQLSENFAPLIRFLRRNVGRPWAKVHAEMAGVLAPSNAVQRHVLVHLEDFLVTNVYESDGQLWGARRGREPTPIVARSRDTFFVHPRTKLLSVVRAEGRSRARARMKQKNPNVHELSPTRQLRRLGGQWYELTVAPFPDWRRRADRVDVVTGRRVRWDTYGLYPEMRDLWESGRFAIARRPVGKRELRDLLDARR